MDTNYAVVFPGQGSQAVGMLKDYESLGEAFLNFFEQASTVLGYDLWKLIQEGPAEKLNKTEVTQPALLVSSVALWHLLQEKIGQAPKFLAGHSLGEYSALVCAGVINFKDAVKLVELRGKLMQAAVPAGSGAMAAVIGLDDEAIIQACATAEEGEVVAPVNFNSPGQVVIAGEVAALERAAELCKEKGARKVMPIPVSVPSHCNLMKPAADALDVELTKVEFYETKLSVINNVDVKIATDANAIKDALVRQLYSPVRWADSVRMMTDAGVETIIECGPGKVLSGLNKRIDKNIKSLTLDKLDSLQAIE